MQFKHVPDTGISILDTSKLLIICIYTYTMKDIYEIWHSIYI